MFSIYLQVIGCGVFAMSIFILGVWLRRHPSKKAAETTSRIAHFFFFFALLLPLVIGLSSPELTYYDELLDIPSLPFPTISMAIGALMMLIGSGFMLISIVVLLDRGQGLPAFELTKKLAAKDIYKRTRNPMALGFNLICSATGLVTGSLFFTLFSLIAVLPAIIFFLKYFEESELEIRFGQPYREYKKKVPFLIPRFLRIPGTESLENGELK
jgi:protein-S-isoprenylcysteine O-methyltransferase Ste14